MLASYYRPSALAAAFGVSLEALRGANLALVDGVWSGQRLVPAGYPLRIPRSPLRPTPDVVLASIPAAERQVEQVREAEYRVRRGDTLSRIAAKFGVRTKDLMAANGIRSANRIHVGQRLEIPGRTRVVAAAPSTAPVPSGASAPTRIASASGTYRVRSGDTLGRIAKRHGISESSLAAENSIRDKSLVRIGQVLRVPGAAGGEATAPGGVYTVRRGDTLDSIARRHGVSPSSIAALNGLANAHRIKAGQRLYLPKN